MSKQHVPITASVWFIWLAASLCREGDLGGLLAVAFMWFMGLVVGDSEEDVFPVLFFAVARSENLCDCCRLAAVEEGEHVCCLGTQRYVKQ